MQARYVIAGDFVTYKGKSYKVKSVECKQGRILIHTEGGTLHFNPNEEVVCD